MPYASLEDLVERAGMTEILQIADRDGDGAADPDVIDAALVHADNIVNGHVGVKYQTPLTAGHDLARTWAVSIARYYLHRYERPEYVIQDHDNALAALARVGSGKMAIPGAAGAAPDAGQTGGTAMARHPSPHFDRLRGWLL